MIMIMNYYRAEHEYLNESEHHYSNEYVEELLSQIDDLELQISCLESEVDELNDELEEKNSRLDYLAQENFNLENRLLILKDDYESVCFRLNHR